MHAGMHLAVNGIGKLDTGTEEYVVPPTVMLSRLSQYLTLFPGDVLTLGKVSAMLEVPEEAAANGFAGSGEIDGLGKIEFEFIKETE